MGKIIKNKIGNVFLALGLVLTMVLTFSLSACGTPSSPDEYMQYVEKKDADQGKEFLVGYLGQMNKAMDMKDSSRVGTIKITPSDNLKSMAALLGDAAPDLSKLENISIETTVGQSDDVMLEKMLFKGNDADILTLNMLIDAKNSRLYYQIPELSEAYLNVDASAAEGEEAEAVTASFALLQSLASGDFVMDSSDVEKIYDRYVEILTKSLKNVEKKEKQKLEAEGVSQNTDVYTATYTKDEAQKLLEDIIGSLKKDEQILSYLKKLKVEEKTYTDELDQILAKLKDEGIGEGTLSLSDYVSDDEIVGREITIKESKDDKEPVVVKVLQPKDGDKFGYLLSVESDGEQVFSVTGQGTDKKEVLNGEFTVHVAKDALDGAAADVGSSLTSDEVLKVKVSDYDYGKLKDGEVSGKYEITCPGIAQIATGKIVYEMSGNMESAKGKLSVLMGEQEMVSMDITGETGDKMDVKLPGDSDKVYDITKSDEIQEYYSGLDIQGVLANVKDKLGIDLSTMFLGASAGLSSASPSDSGDLDLNDLTME